MTDEQLLLTDDLPFSDPPLTDEEADALRAAEMGAGEEEGEEG